MKKTYVLILATIIGGGKPYPSHDTVQQWKTMGDPVRLLDLYVVKRTRGVRAYDDMTQRIRDLKKELRRLTPKEIQRKYPAEVKLCGDWDNAIFTSTKPVVPHRKTPQPSGILSPPRVGGERLDKLNEYRTVIGLPILGPGKWTEQREALLTSARKRAAKKGYAPARLALAAHNKVTRCPPAVAEGAYNDEREAQFKTGHTTHGKTKTQLKKEKRMSRHLARHVAGEVNNRIANTSPNKRTLGDGEIHLSAIAESIGVQPKHARHIARSHAGAIAKLQVEGKKYVFNLAAKDAIVKILRSKS